jgi:hypothetical protein
VRFSSSSPPANPSNHSQSRFAFQDTPSIDSSADSGYPDSPQQQVVGASAGTWGRSMWGNSVSWMTPPPLSQFLQRWRTPSPRAYQSNYMTLVPLSGTYDTWSHDTSTDTTLFFVTTAEAACRGGENLCSENVFVALLVLHPCAVSCGTDDRLKPRRTKLIVGSVVSVALLLAGGWERGKGWLATAE